MPEGERCIDCVISGGKKKANRRTFFDVLVCGASEFAGLAKLVADSSQSLLGDRRHRGDRSGDHDAMDANAFGQA